MIFLSKIGFDVGYSNAFTVSQFYAQIRGRLAVKKFSGTQLEPAKVKEERPSDNDLLISSEKRVHDYMKINFRAKPSPMIDLTAEEWIRMSEEYSTIERIKSGLK